MAQTKAYSDGLDCQTELNSATGQESRPLSQNRRSMDRSGDDSFRSHVKGWSKREKTEQELRSCGCRQPLPQTVLGSEGNCPELMTNYSEMDKVAKSSKRTKNPNKMRGSRPNQACGCMKCGPRRCCTKNGEPVQTTNLNEIKFNLRSIVNRGLPQRARIALIADFLEALVQGGPHEQETDDSGHDANVSIVRPTNRQLKRLRKNLRANARDMEVRLTTKIDEVRSRCAELERCVAGSLNRGQVAEKATQVNEGGSGCSESGNVHLVENPSIVEVRGTTTSDSVHESLTAETKLLGPEPMSVEYAKEKIVKMHSLTKGGTRAQLKRETGHVDPYRQGEAHNDVTDRMKESETERMRRLWKTETNLLRATLQQEMRAASDRWKEQLEGLRSQVINETRELIRIESASIVDTCRDLQDQAKAEVLKDIDDLEEAMIDATNESDAKNIKDLTELIQSKADQLQECIRQLEERMEKSMSERRAGKDNRGERLEDLRDLIRREAKSLVDKESEHILDTIRQTKKELTTDIDDLEKGLIDATNESEAAIVCDMTELIDNKVRDAQKSILQEMEAMITHLYSGGSPEDMKRSVIPEKGSMEGMFENPNASAGYHGKGRHKKRR